MEFLDFILWLALIVYNEGSNQSQHAREVIAISVLNRVEQTQQPPKVLVFKKGQYSWVKHPMQIKTKKDFNVFMECVGAAFTATLDHGAGRKFYGATHFYNPKYASPGWDSKMIFVGKAGDHRFYKKKKKPKKHKR